MNKKRRKTKKQAPIKKDPRDKKAERIIYAVLFILALISVIIGYNMSQVIIEGEKMHEESHSKEIEK